MARNAFVKLDAEPSSDFEIDTFEIDGTDNLFEQLHFLRVSTAPVGATPADPGTTLSDSDQINQILTLETATADEATNTIAATFSGVLSADFTWVLSSLSPTEAILAETFFFMNDSSTQSVLFDWFIYTDWDLDDDSSGDSVEMVGSNIARQTDELVAGIVESLTTPDFFNVSECCEDDTMFDVLDGSGNLPGVTGPLLDDDQALAFQFDSILLAPGENVTYTIIKTVNTNNTNFVPEPGIIALFGLGLAGLGFARRMKA